MNNPPKILIVDDEKDVEILFRQHFRKELRASKFELIFAFSAQEAIEVLKIAPPPDVMYVFSDINMPGMSGLELLEYCKNNYPEVEVSMISAYGSVEHERKAFELGAECFFTKPVDFSLIKALFDKLIG